MKVVKSNNLPSVPAQLYLNCVKEIKGCPVLVRTDCGTENVLMAGAQCFFRRNGDDQFYGNRSHRQGSSPSNQRIESWWSVFRRGSSTWWIDLFKGLSNEGYLNTSNKLHLELMWLCFRAVLQSFLDEVRHHWNTHRIRKSSTSTVNGVPDILYFVPEESGAEECKCPMPSLNEIRDVESTLEFNENTTIYTDYIDYLSNITDIREPQTTEEAFNLYMKLIRIAEQN